MALHAVASCAVLLVAFASALGESVWGPADSVQALDQVIRVVDGLTKLPHLAPETLKRAQQVAGDVKATIELVEHDKKLTKAQAKEKVHGAMKELMDLQKDWTKLQMSALPKNKAALQERMATLQKQLADKKAELAKDENMIKLATLQKELAEKKLMLENLLAQKAGASGKAAQEKQAAEEAAMVKDLQAMAKGLEGVKKGQALTAPLKAMLSSLKTRERTMSEAIDKMDAGEKKEEASMDAAMTGDAKGKRLVKLLKNKAHRKFVKARAMQKAKLVEVKEAVQSIEKRDVAGLKRTLNKMQSEAKALQAKSGDFLH